MKHVLTIALSFLSFTAYGSTWYVNGVTGNDNSSCTSATSPCKTIGNAILLAASGDAVLVGSATYTERLQISIALRIIGAGASTTIVDGGAAGTVLSIVAPVPVTISKLTITNGLAGVGAGINNIGDLTLTNVVITGNQAQSSSTTEGGGIRNGRTLTINNSTIASNSAGGLGGGGIYNEGVLIINKSTIKGNSATSNGGAINNMTGMATVNGSTVSGNTAGALLYSLGGAIFNNATMAINNSTIAGNTVIHGTGGIFNHGSLSLNNSTIANNTRGVDVSATAQATVQNTIVAGNSGGNCIGQLLSNGYNVSSDNTCSFNGPGDLNNTDPLLGPLQDNGGRTQTMGFTADTPAVDAGNPAGCTDSAAHLLKTDQRGKPRPDSDDSGGCDIGAYEHQSDSSTISVSISPTSARLKVGTGGRVFTAKVINDPMGLGVQWSITSPCDFGGLCRGGFIQTSLFSATYRAPLPGPFETAGNPIGIVATSNADPTKSSRATVTIVK